LHPAPDRASSRRLAARRHGFTMVELILVIVLVGIVSAVAMIRFFDRTVYDAATATEQLRAILRYGQKIAIAQHRDVFVQLARDRVALCFANQDPCAADNQVRAPGGENSWCGARDWMCEGHPSNITATINGNADFITIRFDALGQPLAAATDQAAALTVSIAGGATTHTVNVAAETGHVF
jgi:MSHA pilin protein MshC